MSNDKRFDLDTFADWLIAIDGGLWTVNKANEMLNKSTAALIWV